MTFLYEMKPTSDIEEVTFLCEMKPPPSDIEEGYDLYLDIAMNEELSPNESVIEFVEKEDLMSESCKTISTEEESSSSSIYNESDVELAMTKMENVLIVHEIKSDDDSETISEWDDTNVRNLFEDMSLTSKEDDLSHEEGSGMNEAQLSNTYANVILEEDGSVITEQNENLDDDDMTLNSNETDGFFDDCISLNTQERKEFDDFAESNPISMTCGGLFFFPSDEDKGDFFLPEDNLEEDTKGQDDQEEEFEINCSEEDDESMKAAELSNMAILLPIAGGTYDSCHELEVDMIENENLVFENDDDSILSSDSEGIVLVSEDELDYGLNPVIRNESFSSSDQTVPIVECDSNEMIELVHVRESSSNIGEYPADEISGFLIPKCVFVQ